MSLALVDCPTGLAGNMLLAALFDLGLPQAAVDAPLAALGLAGAYAIDLEERRSGGLRGLHLAVRGLEAEPPHRHWAELKTTIAGAALEAQLKQRVLAVFGLLAEAEAQVHGQPAERVHFHEVGAIDALVDVVGVCAGLAHFGITQLVCATPPAGHGTVQTAHGLLPLPAPAVLELARLKGIPLASSEGFPAGELTTPTGLALMAALADRFGLAPALVPQAVGIGLGSRQLDRPNLLRLVLAADAQGAGPGLPETALPEILLQQQAQIDDATPEDLAFLADELRRAGALEVFSQPLLMKKGRPGVLVTVLARPEQAEALRRIWWRQGTSLGVREQLQQRWALPRSSRELATPLGPVRLKQVELPEGERRSKPEFEDLADLARRHGLPLAQVRLIVAAALAQEELQP
ncbi:MAG: nickel pincer cofactor biosynthesis protein LarC [Synechococcales cyanobacterium SupBloom_Metag_052]|nr:nickel pincer cofactor biosynthesis protein LarC [Synechococcales cyanobacterium SupBloom_Metag_052]